MKVLNPRMKYIRLLRLVLQLGVFSTACGFVLGYFWDYGLGSTGLTKELVVARGIDALKHGMWAGIVLGFPMWLALEKFMKPRKRPDDERPIKSRGEA